FMAIPVKENPTLWIHLLRFQRDSAPVPHREGKNFFAVFCLAFGGRFAITLLKYAGAHLERPDPQRSVLAFGFDATQVVCQTEAGLTASDRSATRPGRSEGGPSGSCREAADSFGVGPLSDGLGGIRDGRGTVPLAAAARQQTALGWD